MQEASQSGLDLTFPKEYQQRLEEYRKRRVGIHSKSMGVRKPTTPQRVLSDNCKQAISLVNKVYCCALKELVDASLCKGCPCYEREPLEYSLFRRV